MKVAESVNSPITYWPYTHIVMLKRHTGRSRKQTRHVLDRMTDTNVTLHLSKRFIEPLIFLGKEIPRGIHQIKWYLLLMTNFYSQDKPNGNKMNFNLRQWMFITASELNGLFCITERNSLVPAYKYRTSLDVAFRGLEPLIIIERIVWYLPHVQNYNQSDSISISTMLIIYFFTFIFQDSLW